MKMDDTLEFEVEFWEAQIEVDAILSFPWMCEHKIGIFPHHQALAMDHPVFKLLYGRPKKSNRKFGPERQAHQIDTQPKPQENPRQSSRRRGRGRHRSKKARSQKNWRTVASVGDQTVSGGCASRMNEASGQRPHPHVGP